jgi:hypothetical protein
MGGQINGRGRRSGNGCRLASTVNGHPVISRKEGNEGGFLLADMNYLLTPVIICEKHRAISN